MHETLLKALTETDPERVARDVLELSSFYLQNPGRHTPWSQPYARNAYLSYFLPLNMARLRAAMREVLRFIPLDEISEIWDYGSGIGTTQWVLEEIEAFTPRPLYAIERSTEAVGIYQELLRLRTPQWKPQFSSPARPQKGALAVFSYSFLEMQNALPDWREFSHLLIVEPSTRECGRTLMEWRQKFIASGMLPLAPCTHQGQCPLLLHSGRDWCHMRVEYPGWWPELEAELPMKNRTLTYSYLLLSQTVTDKTWRGAARAIGDTLEERGKTRQMICRGEAREFLSWLHRHGEPPRIPHGALIRGVENCEPRGAELRPTSTLEWFE